MNSETLRLVYEHKANGRNMVPDGICFMSDYDLVLILSQRKYHVPKSSVHRLTSLQMRTSVWEAKKIKPGSTTIEIWKADLMTEKEKVAAAKVQKSKDESEEVAWPVFLGYAFEGHCLEELTILVPEVVAKGGE